MKLRKWVIISSLLVIMIIVTLIVMNNIPRYFAENKPENIIFEHPFFLYYGEKENIDKYIGKKSLDQYSYTDRMIYFSLLKSGDIRVTAISNKSKSNNEYSSAFTVKDMNELQNKLLEGTIDNKNYSINISKADIRIQYDEDMDRDGFIDIVDDYQSVLVCTIPNTQVEKNHILQFITPNKETFPPIETKYFNDYVIYVFRLPYTDLESVTLDNFIIPQNT